MPLDIPFLINNVINDQLALNLGDNYLDALHHTVIGLIEDTSLTEDAPNLQP